MLEVVGLSVLAIVLVVVIIIRIGLLIGYGIDFSFFMWLRYGKAYAVWCDIRPHYDHDKMTELLSIYRQIKNLRERTIENLQHKEQMTELRERIAVLEKKLFCGRF